MSTEGDFDQGVRRAFGFLVDDYGYSVVTNDLVGEVVFSRGPLSLVVFREPRSFMIYLEIRRYDTNEAYLLHEVIHALAPQRESESQCSGADMMKMCGCLKQLSKLVRDCLHGVLTMDEVTFSEIAISAKLNRVKVTLDAQYGVIKDRANQAWERKEWEKARELYAAAKPALSAEEERRLEFLLQKQL